MKNLLVACLVPVCIVAVTVPIYWRMHQTKAQVAPLRQLQIAKDSSAAHIPGFHTVKGTGFSVQMPGDPTIIRSLDRIGETEVPVIEYRFKPSDHLGYLLVVMETPTRLTPDNPMTQAILDKFSPAAFADDELRVIANESFTFEGNPAREMTFLAHSTRFSKIRILMAGNHAYFLTAVDEGQGKQQDIDNFMKSFKLTK